MYYLTTNFYLLGGTLCVLASFFMFNSYFKVKRAENLSLAFVFFWIGLHSFAFALPTIIDKNDLSLLGIGYIFGIGMIFLALLSGINVQVFMAKKIIASLNTVMVKIIISLLAITTLSIMIIDFKIPIINNMGVIFWNINPIAMGLVGVTSFIYGTIWGMVFYRSALLINDGLARVKMLVMSANGFILGTVALLVHTSSNEIQTILGHSMFIVAGAITLAIYLLPKRMFRVN